VESSNDFRYRLASIQRNAAIWALPGSLQIFRLGSRFRPGQCRYSTDGYPVIEPELTHSPPVLRPHIHLGHGTATVFARYFGRMLARNTHLPAPAASEHQCDLDLHRAVKCCDQSARTLPVQSQTAICAGKNNSVAAVCVARLGWREEVISDE
jgi:hypothetical protein